MVILNKLLPICAALAFCLNFSGADAGTQRTVYVTVDDGPLGGTDNILEVLQEENVRATFFMVGEHILASDYHHAAFLRAKDSPYVLVGNHSYSHAHDHYQHFYSSRYNVLRDMETNNRIIGLTSAPFYARLPGRDVFRLPAMSFDDPFLKAREDDKERIDFDTLQNNGFYLYGWDLEWAHKTSGVPIQSVKHLMEEIDRHFNTNNTKMAGHLILLMHDQMFVNHLNGKENFSSFIKALKNKGYTLETVDKYPGNFVTAPASK